VALLIYSRSPYLMTLGQHTIRKPLWQFARIVIRQGVQGAWTIVSLLVGVGLVGVLGWALTRPLTAVLLAVAAFVVLVLAIGSYRAWLAAARFVPNLPFDAQRRADALNAWSRSRGDELPGKLMNYQASMVQDALIDFDRFTEAGLLDSRATREQVAHPKNLNELNAVIALFQDAADRARSSPAST
jgi:hypothetical protein